MRKFAVLIFLFLHTFILACKCDGFGKIGIQFQNADFVGEIEILSITPKKNSRSYIADVKTLNVYKGKGVHRIEVLGLLGDIRSGSCEVEFHVGEKYIIYLSKEGGDNIMSMTSSGNVNISEKFMVSRCTPKTLILNESRNLNIERQVLNYLQGNPLNLSQAFYFDNSATEGEGDFKKIEILNPKNYFAVYKIKVNGKSEVENIEAIKNFASDQDAEIMSLIKKNFVIVKDFLTEVRNEEVLLTLFYIPENKEKEFQSSISLDLPTNQQ